MKKLNLWQILLILPMAVMASEAALWTIGGAVCDKSTVYLDTKITQGTNSQQKKAALIARLHRLLLETLGELAQASYIVIHELPAENWGYAGLTQAACAGNRLNLKKSVDRSILIAGS